MHSPFLSLLRQVKHFNSPDFLNLVSHFKRGSLAALATTIALPAAAAVFQAEDYTYSFDTTPGNTGGQYRSDDVDIEATSDNGGGYNVGYIDTGEWLSFSGLDIPTSGTYIVRMRVASASGDGSFNVDLNGGATLLAKGSVPNTGGWQNWTTIEYRTQISAGTHSLGVFANAGGWNFNWIEVVADQPTPTPTPTPPPANGVATVYQHCNYTGWSAQLNEGQYRLADLAQHGFVNDDASSIRVSAGYEVVLYKDDNFTGGSVTLTADSSCLVAQGANDDISSIVIRKQGVQPTSQHNSEKRGLAYGGFSANDMAAVRHKIKWWYNWAAQPEAGVANVYQNYDVEFVPMAWDENFDENVLRAYLNAHPNVKYILGFNEPNFAEQANLTPAQAAAQWPRIEAIARDYNLKIVGPAVNFSPGQVDIPGTDDDSSPWAYLDAFFAACPNCQVDYIAVHCYMKEAFNVDWFVKEFERYGKPIWVTEWASWDDGGPANVNEQMNYMAESVRMLEANPNVFRYSWFIGRWQGANTFPYIDVLANDGELTPLGGLYTSIPGQNYRYQVPTRIEAEGAHTNFGFEHEATTDATGGYVNLCWTNTGDYLEYKIHVPQAGNYTIDFRLATQLNGRSFNVLLDGGLLYTQRLDSTGGWQSWNTFSQTVNLPAGDHTLRIEALTNDINFNWLEIR